jgi:outer membrane protein assembly factor BamB/ankyrin repeat protein
MPVCRALLLNVLLLTSAALADEREDRFFAAARRGELPGVTEALQAGVPVNAKTRYGVTALTYASRHGHAEVVKALLEAGAEVNVADSFYHGTPLSAAAFEGHAEVVRLLLKHGAKNLDGALENAIYSGSVEVVQMILDAGDVRPQTVRSAMRLAESLQKNDLLEQLKAKHGEGPERLAIPTATLESYVGEYASDRGGEYEVRLENGALHIGRKGGAPVLVEATDSTTFLYFDLKFSFVVQEGRPLTLVRQVANDTLRFERVASPNGDDLTHTPDSSDSPLASESSALANWPQFRGVGAVGVADGQNPPTVWDVPKNQNVRWKTPIPGLAHSCPIVWGDKVFVTTAVRLNGEAKVRTGVYGDVESVNDNSPHAWRVYCLHKTTGEILWERTAHEGAPRVKRHPKSSQANCTPATDGEHVVAFFASEGLYCFDVDGKLLWKKDLGVLDSGWFFDPDMQWGFASSPIIYQGLVIVQCDIQKNSYLAAYRLSDGVEVWRTPRDEIPTWCTPTLCETSAGPQLVTGGTMFARAYNPVTGEELWRLADHSEIAIPTPFYAGGLIYVASGYRPIKPIYAIRPTARGDISLKDNATSNEHIVWSRHWGGPYTPTPLVYGDYLYVCDNDGILTCYAAKTGKQVYRHRVRNGGAASFSASPVAADGRIYLPSEEGVMVVVRAGPKCEVLSANPLGEECLASPAISEELMIVRTKDHVVAVGENRVAE